MGEVKLISVSATKTPFSWIILSTYGDTDAVKGWVKISHHAPITPAFTRYVFLFLFDFKIYPSISRVMKTRLAARCACHVF